MHRWQHHPSYRQTTLVNKLQVTPGHGILAHRYADGSLHVYAALNRPGRWTASIDLRDKASAMARIAAEFQGWAPYLMPLIPESDTAPVLRPIYALPVEHRWERVPGVAMFRKPVCTCSRSAFDKLATPTDHVRHADRGWTGCHTHHHAFLCEDMSCVGRMHVPRLSEPDRDVTLQA